MVRLIVSIFILIAMNGCFTSPHILEIGGADVPLIDYSDTNNYRIIPLETCDGSTYSSLDKMLINDSVIVILDREERKVILFNIDGSFRSCINQEGRANNEYINIGDIALYDHQVYLFDIARKRML